MYARTRVKICGMTNLIEVKHAVRVGVDALGFIFAPQSPRYIDPEDARELVASLPPFIGAVGVFVNEEPERVEEIAKYCGLTVLQLHGDESPEYCRQFPGRRVVKAIQVRQEISSDILTPYEDIVYAFLFDTFHEKLPGGTGQTFDWSLVKKLQSEKPIILAGGIGIDNVTQAINEVRPFAVDVNSTLETEPGRKDPELVTRLLEKVAGV